MAEDPPERAGFGGPYDCVRGSGRGACFLHENMEDRGHNEKAVSPSLHSKEDSSMRSVIVQLSTVTVALAFGLTTFAQVPAPQDQAPSAPPASVPAPAPDPIPPPAPAPTPSSGEIKQEGEKRTGGERHRNKAERKAEKERRKAERKAEKEKRKAEKKARKQGRHKDKGNDKDELRDDHDKKDGTNQ